MNFPPLFSGPLPASIDSETQAAIDGEKLATADGIYKTDIGQRDATRESVAGVIATGIRRVSQRPQFAVCRHRLKGLNWHRITDRSGFCRLTTARQGSFCCQES